MKRILCMFVAGAMVAGNAFADDATTQSRRSMATQWMSAPRAVASKNQLSAGTKLTANADSIAAANPSAPAAPGVKNNRDKEKAACVGNNIGIGNTFVWASRYSNVNDYSSMVEDTDAPDNNTCFVRVELKSNDSKISLSDIPGQYYEMGRDITCGMWADSDKIRQRILDAKKSARTWGTVAGVVGSAGVGVGIMELVGNKWIDGRVQGQKNSHLTDEERMRSQLLVLKKENLTQYNEIKEHVSKLAAACNDDAWNANTSKKPDECKFDYKYLLSGLN